MLQYPICQNISVYVYDIYMKNWSICTVEVLEQLKYSFGQQHLMVNV